MRNKAIKRAYQIIEHSNANVLDFVEAFKAAIEEVDFKTAKMMIEKIEKKDMIRSL